MPSEPVLGQIMPTAFNIVPRGWARCDGSLLGIQQNQALFSLFGTRFGGDGVQTFGLPDLRGRGVLGAASAAVMGAQNGTTTVTLTSAQVPAHAHALLGSTTAGTGRGASPADHVFGVNKSAGDQKIFGGAGGEVALAVGTNVVPNAGDQPHNNMQPYLVINYLVALQGTYPSRN
ncbi:phage tail protein [Dongia sp. agr-C8]